MMLREEDMVDDDEDVSDGPMDMSQEVKVDRILRAMNVACWGERRSDDSSCTLVTGISIFH